MAVQIVALLVFAAVFVIAEVRRSHIGIVMFAAACGVGLLVAGQGLEEILEGFPVDILILLVGVTFFFGIAKSNGTIGRLLDLALARVGDNVAALPLVFFALTGVIASMGSPLGGLVTAPIGMSVAARRGIDPMLMGIAMACGLSAGGFAPISLFGLVTTGTAAAAGVALNPLVLFATAIVANVLLLALAYVLVGSRAAARRRGRTGAVLAAGSPGFDDRESGSGGSPTSSTGTSVAPGTGTSVTSEAGTSAAAPESAIAVTATTDSGTRSAASRSAASGSAASGSPASGSPAAEPAGSGTAGPGTTGPDSPGEAREPFRPIHVVTVAAMVGLLAAVVAIALTGAEPDIGVLAFVFGAALTLVDPPAGRRALSEIDWSTVLLVGGIITYVGVLQEAGTVDMLGEVAAGLAVPLLAAFLVCVVCALVSAFASTTGILAALVPLAIPLIQQGGVPGWALLCALGVCSSLVDVSPFSTVGATMVASATDPDERPRMTSLLTRWGLSMVVIGPIALLGALMLPAMAL